MDRNLTERLKKLSKELADAKNAVEHHGNEYTDEELDKLYDRIDDLQDDIWDIEDQLREQAENEYDDHSAKGWN
jgi:cell division protein FtsB